MNNLEEYEHIIWDWNGTLFNDVELCHSIMNKLLAQQSKATITLEQYKNIFTFPVIEYYKLAGHTFETISFEELGKQFIDEYESRKNECGLFPEVYYILKYFQENNIKQYLLSAYKQDLLDETLDFYDLKKYFTTVIGLDNIYATSKVHLGKQLVSSITRNGSNQQMLLIGDTEHDLEVAQAIGVDCIIIAAGHQSREKLSSISGISILDNLEDFFHSINTRKNS
jgi:phosphoglycolate phosphatase